MHPADVNLLETGIAFTLSCTLFLPSNILIKAITVTVVALLVFHIGIKLSIDL